MFKFVGRVHKAIIIYKIFVSSIIGRINIDNIDFAFVGFLKKLKGGKIISFNQEVLFSSIFDLFKGFP